MANDILLDGEGDLKIVNGDFAVGDAESQHVEDLAYSFKGEWKEHPLLGAAAQRKIKQGNSLTKLKKEIKEALEADGYGSISVTISGTDININAERL